MLNTMSHKSKFWYGEDTNHTVFHLSEWNNVFSKYYVIDGRRHEHNITPINKVDIFYRNE